jgi:hypothetical protein
MNGLILAAAMVTIQPPAGHVLTANEQLFGEAYCAGYVRALHDRPPMARDASTGQLVPSLPASVQLTWQGGVTLTCQVGPQSQAASSGAPHDACADWIPQQSTEDTHEDRVTRAKATALINSGVPELVDSGNAMMAGVHNRHVWAAEENAADRAAVCGQPTP